MQLARDSFVRTALAVLIASGVLAPLAIHLAAGRTLAWFDTMAIFAPQRWLVEEALRSCRLPLWNPYSATGIPLFADAIHGVLHPVSILTAWLQTGRSVDLLIASYVVCAGLGAALLARELGTSLAAAALAGVAYGASGYVLSTAGLLTFLAGAASLPFGVAGLRRFARAPTPGSLAFGVVGVAVLGLSGDAQALMVGGATALALAWEAGGWRGAVRAALAGTVGLLVAAVQLYPSAVHVPRTVRAEGLWSSNPSEWAFEPWRIPELVLPGLFAGEDPYSDPLFAALSFPGGLPDQGHPFPFIASVFVGILPLSLAIAGAREGRRGRLLGALALGFLWIALGPRLGATSLLEHVPVWRAFRYSEKLVGPLTLVLGVLAGVGLDRVVERRVAGWKVLAGAAALGVASIAGQRLVTSRLPPDLLAMAGERASLGSWHVAGALVALAGWLMVRDRLRVSQARAALAVLAWAGMAAASPAALRPGDPDSRLRARGPALEAPPPGPRVAGSDTLARSPHRPGADRIGEAARDFAAVWRPAFNVAFRVDSLSEYAALAPLRLTMLNSHVAQGRWLVAARRYAATHLFLDPGLAASDAALYADATSGGARVGAAPGADEIWAIPHRAWASFPQGVRVVPDLRAATAETGRAIAERSGDAVVEASSPFRAGEGRVLSIERSLEALRVEAESDEDGTLVIADAWWPGWEATIDGRLVAIFPADVLIRAVRWPAGRHVLEMRYRPPEVRDGILLSTLGLLTTAAWALFLRRAAARRARLVDGKSSSGPG